MKLITGSSGTLHITSNNDGEFNQGIWGDGAVILSNGNQLSATIVNNNTIRIDDGDLVWQGRHALIEPNTSEDVNIETGQAGYNRIDLICARYTLANGIETIQLVVKKGTASTGTPTVPSYTSGVIRTGATVAEVPIYQVNIQGITITSVDKIVKVMPYIVSVVNRKIDYGTSLPSASDYSDGDVFLLYK